MAWLMEWLLLLVLALAAHLLLLLRLLLLPHCPLTMLQVCSTQSRQRPGWHT
jgi:hypothetical protein